MGTHTKRRQMSLAYRYSSSRLALNYYSFYESLLENPPADEILKERCQVFHQVMGDFLNGRDCLEKLDNLRNHVIHDMEIVTSYVDCFQIYEYVLNRMERRFTEAEPVNQSIDAFAAEITAAIAKSGDTVLMNHQIQEVIGQLPLRYTRQKFYSLVMERLTVYTGAGKKSLNDLLDMLETSSMVKLSADRKDVWPELYDLLEVLRCADYRNMDKGTFENCQGCMVLGSSRLNTMADDGILLINLINDLYVLRLCQAEALTDGVEDQVVRQILLGVWKRSEEEKRCELPDEITELLCQLEGIQESCMDFLMQSENPENEKDPELAKINRLLSGSFFADLELDDEKEEPADRKWIEEQGKKFCERLDETLKTLPKPVARAVMAKILSSLPVIFANTQELETYIKNSLDSCTDAAERETAMELLSRELMDEDALV